MKRRYYLAYGSNLNIRQMQMRCPMAKPVGAVALEGYELLFRGVATIEPKADSHVLCGLWLITAKDEAALDRYEGFPHLYRKEMVPIQFGKRKMRVMTYIMTDGHAISAPSRGYLHTIMDGYGDFRLDSAVLDAAVRKSICLSAQYPPLD